MEKLKAKIVIVEDDVQLKDDPFIEEAKDVFEEVIFIENSCVALEYIESHITEKMIVVLDLEFTYNMPNGREILNRIREISFLVPVVIWSAVDEGTDTVSELIRNRAFAYYKKGATSDDLIDGLKKAFACMSTDISSVIEEWINEHSEEKMDKPFFTTTDGKSYSLKEILREIRLQTELGIEIARNINKLTIDLLMRSKEKLS